MTSKFRHYEICPPGVVMGLSWTPMGGSALYVETVIEGTRDHDEGLKTTGQMGEVMKESSNIAFTYARNFLYSVAPENRFFEQVRHCNSKKKPVFGSVRF